MDSEHKQKDEKFGLKECIKDHSGNGEQNFTLTWHKDIRPKGRTVCWDVSDPNDKAEIALYPCHGMKGNQYWRYDVVSIVSVCCVNFCKNFYLKEKQWFIHGGNPRCLDCDPGARKLYVTKCDDDSKTQKWRFENINLTMIANWENVGPP